MNPTLLDTIVFGGLFALVALFIIISMIFGDPGGKGDY